MKNSVNHYGKRGFSLIEVLAVVAIVAVVAAVAIGFVPGIKTSVDDLKLKNDVTALNSSVGIFLASGGSLDGVTEPQQVLNKLKTIVNADLVKRMPGMAGSMIDPRLEVVMAAEVPDGDFAEWNPATRKFEIVSGGVSSQRSIIKTFALTGDPEAALATEVRDATMLYSKEGTWVWDYQDRPATIPEGPTEVALAVVPENSIPPSTPVQSPPPPLPPLPPPGALQPPAFSIPPGSFPITAFDLSVVISNPNPAGSSTLIYSLDYGRWSPPGPSVTVGPDQILKAQAVPIDPVLWGYSRVVAGTYASAPGTLLPPGITLSNPAFDPGGSPPVDNVTVTIANPNDPAVSRIDYRLNGGSWQSYAGPFSVAATAWPKGVTIESYAAATGGGWADSDITSAVVGEGSEFFGVNLDGDVLMVLDASGSMSLAFSNTTRFRRVIEEAIDAISTLPETQKFGVIAFNSGLHWSDGSGDLKPATPENKEAAINGLRSLRSTGGTNYKVGLSYAVNLATLPTQVVFLSDGLPNQPNYFDEIDELVSLGIEVYTVGIGNFSSQGPLEELATLAGGSYRFVAEPGASGTLTAPEFSRDGNDFDYDQFPIALTLTNPNSDPASQILYSVNGGALQTYSGPITVGYNTTVTASTESADPSWLKSSEVSESYLVKAFDADKPEIQLTSDKFEDSNPTITVTLDDRNSSGLTSLIWWFEHQSESNAVAYNGPFILSAADWETYATDSMKEVRIVTRAVATASFVTSSSTENKTIKNETTAFLDNLKKDPLDRPTFSPEGDDFDYPQFPIEVSLTNPNVNEGELLVSINGGAYAPYTASISADYNTSITAYVKATRGKFRSSEVVTEVYTVDSVNLKRPLISISDEIFNPSVQSITVTATNPNPVAISQVIYWFDGQDADTDAVVYTGPIVLTSNNWESYIKEGKSEAKLLFRAVGAESFVKDSGDEDVRIKNKN